MKLQADTDALHDAFQYSGSIITSSMPHAVYENVKLTATGEGVWLSATDMEVGLKVKVPDVEVVEEGTILLREANVSKILGATPDEEVNLETEEDVAYIRSSDSEFRLLTHPAEEFEDINEPGEGNFIEIDPQILRYMVRRTRFAAAEERGRYALHGILLEVEENSDLHMVAADGARLALVKKKADNPDELAFECIVPTKGMEQLAKLAGLSKEPLRIQVTDSELLAANDAGCVSCLLVEGQFPDYKSIIPENPTVKLDLPVQPLLNAVRRASYMTTRETRAADFLLSANQLTIKAESPELGEAKVTVPVEYEQEDVEITLNPEYVEDVLRVAERESVKLEFNCDGSPCALKSGYDYTYLISPVVREEAEV